MTVSRKNQREQTRKRLAGHTPLSLVWLVDDRLLALQHCQVLGLQAVNMGKICFVYGCTHRHGREKCSFHRFPHEAAIVLFTPHVPVCFWPSRHNFRDIELKFGILS